jgi:hypothetical protein
VRFTWVASASILTVARFVFGLTGFGIGMQIPLFARPFTADERVTLNVEIEYNNQERVGVHTFRERYSLIDSRKGGGCTMPSTRPLGVSVVPNASTVRGSLTRILPEAEGDGAIWEIRVDEAKDAGGLANFVRAYVGKPIHVYVQPHLQHHLAENDRLEARIAFRGDEHGGRFVLIGDDIHRL